MRYSYSATAVASLLFSSVVFGQSLSITNYQLVSQQQGPRNQVNMTFKADLVNNGPVLGSVTATVSSTDPFSIRVQPGEDTLNFSPVPANSHVTSANTFTLLVDSTVPLDFSKLEWTFTTTQAPPVANAGPNQTATVGTTVTLNGSGSTNPSGIGTLTYNWVILSRPAGSSATLTNPTSVMPGFFVDVAGNYQIRLTVNNGTANSSATVNVSTMNTPPVANAGPNQTVPVGATALLNGSASSDVDGNPLTYAWTLTGTPAGSAAVLSGANTVSPSFVVDKPGSYTAQLIVNDGFVNSAPATVTLTTQNTPPVANAGPNQVVTLGATVQLNGSGSTDVDGNPLTYSWTLITRPVSSVAVLSNPTAVNPTFVADIAGTYVAQLIVNDGFVNGNASTVTVTTTATQAPVADAGMNQTVAHKTVVQLTGGGTDPQMLPLTYHWALINKPVGSAATLSDPNISNPTFFADQPGTYVAQLIVNDGVLNSAPATVTITTTNTPPVANAGQSRNVTAGATVQLDGTGSSDADNDPLTYSWSLTSVPAGSAATLAAANTATPSFQTDVPGTYVAQLIVNDGFANGNPATVTITAFSTGVTLTPNPLNLSIAPGTLTVTIPVPAGAAGQIVTLVSTNPGVASVPGSVTVLQGMMTAAVTVTPGVTGSATILASSPGFISGTATVNVAPVSISIAVSAQNIGITRTVNGTVTLSAPASGDVVVTLTSAPGGIVSVAPNPVTVVNGTTGATFTITGLAVGQATITASSPGYGGGAATVNVNKLGLIFLQPNVMVAPGLSAPIQVTLASVAPVGGVTIAFTSSDPLKATVTPSVFIPFGATTPGTQPQVTGVALGSTTITASAPGFDGDSKLVLVASAAFVPSTLTLPAPTTQNLTLTFLTPAPAAGFTVTLSSDNASVATVPATVPVPGNATSVQVPVTAIAPGTTVIHASSLPAIVDTTAVITVVSGGQIILPGSVTLALGQSAPFPIALPLPAPAGGLTVTLVSNDTSKVTISPGSVFIPANAISPATQPQVFGVGLGSANVSASAPGFTPGVGTVQVIATIAFSPSAATITVPATQLLTLMLSSAAPASGLTVNLSSSNSAVATVPATATFAAGSTTVSVPVTAVAPGSAVIHASAPPNVADTTANITVVAAGPIGLPVNPAVALGSSATFAVTLPTPAPAGGVTVTLSSGNPSKVTVTPSIFFPAGATTPSTPAQITGVGFPSAAIMATAPSYSSSSVTVLVTATVVVSGNGTIVKGATQNLVLTLSAPAPAGGLTVTVSSDNPAVAMVPSAVTFAQNATTVNLPVTGVAPGSAIIHTGAVPNVPDVSFGVTVVAAPTGIILPANVTLPKDSVTPFPVTLATPAPAGGVFIMLTSSDPSVLTISPNAVLIQEGATAPAAVTPKVNGVSLGTAMITASASGYPTVSQQVTVTP